MAKYKYENENSNERELSIPSFMSAAEDPSAVIQSEDPEFPAGNSSGLPADESSISKESSTENPEENLSESEPDESDADKSDADESDADSSRSIPEHSESVPAANTDPETDSLAKADTKTAVAESDTDPEKRKRSSIVRLIILAAAAAVLIGYTAYGMRYHTVFLPSTFINGFAVGNASASQYENYVAKQLADWELTVTFPDDSSQTVTASDIDLEYSPDGSIESYIARQNTMVWVAGFFGYRRDVSYTPTVIYDYQKLLAVMDTWPELAEENITRAENAYLTFDGRGRLKLVPEVVGNELDVDKISLAIRGAIKNTDSALDLGTIDGIEIKPTVYSDDEALNSCLEDINGFLGTTVSWTMSDGSTETLDSTVMSKWLIKQADGTYTITDQIISNKVGAFISELAAKDDNYGTQRSFNSTNYGTVILKTESIHGHTMDQAAMIADVTDALENRESKTLTLKYTEYEDSGRAVNGNTYLEVDIDNQTVYYYLDGELVNSWEVVTGRSGSRSTPYGIYQLERKISDTILMGPKNENGVPSYASHVDYFNQFFPSYGFHDASWRSSSEFGGTTYIERGSHGCINMPLEGARYIYENVEIGTPVIVFSNDHLDTTVLRYHEARNYTAECQTHDDINSAEEDDENDISPNES